MCRSALNFVLTANNAEGAKFFRILVFAYFALFAVQFHAAAAPANKLNLVLITIDTLRADHLSCNGSKIPTPNLDRLAREGVNFTRARSPVPLTLPSHASIMTAMYPPNHGVRDNGTFRLADGHTTLAEILKQRGYQTAAFTGSFVLDQRFGLGQGFNIYDDETSSDPAMLENTEAERNAQAVYQAFASWFKKRNQSRSYFAWIHLYDPHAPYFPPEPYFSKFKRNLYAGEVAYIDDIVGKITRDVSAPKSGNLIIAVVGDHGEGLGQHDELTHSVLIYNSTLQVPMIIHALHLIKPNTAVAALTRTIDLAPTLLDYLGIDHKIGDGTTLRPLIEGKPASFQLYSESLYARLNLGWSDLHGLESGNYHYIESPSPELFDIQKDPQETKNIIKEQPEMAQRMASELKAISNSVAASRASKQSIDSETREKLASLGYVSGTTTENFPPVSRVDPKRKMNEWNQIQFGISQLSTGRHRAAAATFEGVIRKEKDVPLVYEYLATAYIKLKDLLSAERVLKQAISRNIRSSSLHTHLGTIYLERQETRNAEAEFQSALTIDPTNVTAHYYLGNVYRAKKDVVKAADQYRLALEINPNYVFAKNGLGMALSAQGKDEEALQAFRAVVRENASQPAAYFNLAVQLEKMKRVEEAGDAYRKFLSFPASEENRLQRQRALQALKRLGPGAPR